MDKQKTDTVPDNDVLKPAPMPTEDLEGQG